MNILWVATKAPWPARDGGRLLLAGTLRALAAAGHRVTLVAPVDPRQDRPDDVTAALEGLCRPRLVAVRPRPVPLAVLDAAVRRVPLAMARHRQPAVRARVRQLAPEHDVVVAEQLHAWPQARAAGLPTVLRAQNVESDLWRGQAGSPSTPSWQRALLRYEAARLARYEGRVVAGLAGTMALTAEDAARLQGLAGTGAPVEVVPPPFPAALPAAASALPGAPSVVILGSGGWRPNHDGARWFVDRVWPRVRARLQDARLHCFGGCDGWQEPGAGVTVHAAPADSRDAFAPGAIVAVPLAVASGIRMKILEAWARGLPVVATEAAARGLGLPAGEGWLRAQDPDGFADAIARLHEAPALGTALVRDGRRQLEAAHTDAAIANRLIAVLEAACKADLGGGRPRVHSP